MGWYDWLLFLHVLAAFALVAAMTGFWVLAFGTRPARPQLSGPAGAALARPLGVMVAAGTIGTLVLGIWLAVYVDGHELWDGWIFFSVGLWLIGTGTGERSGRSFGRAAEGGAEAPGHWRRAVTLLAVSSAAILMILLLMIFKPGA